MAIEKIIDINVNAEPAVEATKSLKAQLREAQAEVAALSDKFGATSREAVEAAKRASELKDKIGDAKALTDAFNPDAKFKALSSSLSGVAGGFAAVQGAMGLMGSESKAVEATLLKVQSAMALSQGLQALGESVDSFKQLKAVALNALNSIKTAIGSTGIGLLVVALGTIVAYWDDIAKSIDGATKETKAYEEANKEVTDSLNKTYTSLNSVKMSIDNAKKGIISKESALKTYNEKLGDALGKTDDLDVAEKRMADNTGRYIQAQIARANAAAFLAKASEAATKAATGEDLELDWWQTLKAQFLSVGSGMGMTAASVESATKSMSENAKKNAEQQVFYSKLAQKETEKADALTTEINAAGINKRYEADKKANEDKKEAEKKAREEALEEKKKKEQEDLEALKAFQKSVRDAENEDLEQKIKDKEAQDERFKKATEELNAWESEQDQKRLNEKKLKAEAEKAIQQATLDFSENAIGSLKIIFAKNKEVQKGLLIAESAVGIAKIIVNTQTANAAATAASPLTGGQPFVAFNTISAGLGIAANIAATAKALKELGGGSAGAGASSMPASNGGGNAPSFNIVGDAGVNSLTGAVQQNKQAPVQAYVVAQNVTTAQSLNRNIVENATLG